MERNMFHIELEQDIDAMAALAMDDKVAFAMNRRKGFGASDSSIILGVNKWTTPEQLIAQKNTDGITKEELEVGEKPQVRMGADLEDFLLHRWANLNKLFVPEDINKPDMQYRFKDFPYLTVNFDGLLHHRRPVEFKFTSMYAHKHWNWDKGISEFDPEYAAKLLNLKAQRYGSAASLQEHIKVTADMYGIPPYYFTQIQQQIMAMNADYGYLVAMKTVDWTMYTYKIYADEPTQEGILVLGAKYAEQCPGIPKAKE